VFGRIITLKDAWAKATQKAEAPAKAPKPAKQAPKPEPTEKAAPAALTPEQEAEVARLTALGVPDAEARTLARDAALLTFLGGAAQDSTFAQVASWTANDLAPGLRAGEVRVGAADLAPLAALLSDKKVTTRVAREVLARAAQTGEAPATIIDRENLAGSLSEDALNAAIAQVLADNADKVDAYRAGRTALLGFFTGQVMRLSGGKADPATLNAALTAALAG